jgi:hypothetical protein
MAKAPKTSPAASASNASAPPPTSNPPVGDYQVVGNDPPNVLFSLKIHRGDGMCLLAMNWKGPNPPPNDFVGFAIEFQPPGSTNFQPINNRLAFPSASGAVNAATLSSRVSPIQKFRWVHFPDQADQPGVFTYQVTPVFMDDSGQLSYGVAQQAQLNLSRETVPGQMNVGFTRGFVSSQAFVDRFQKDGPIAKLLPSDAAHGLMFQPSHPDAQAAYDWMGFEARKMILGLLDDAIADPTANVCAVAYDLNEPEVVDRLEKLGPRLKMIIDDSGSHAPSNSSESLAFQKLQASAGAANLKRQHMGELQHNKFIVAGGAVNRAVCGSTNFSWRAFFVQNNNAVVVEGPAATGVFKKAFDDYWAVKSNAVADFSGTAEADWQPLGLPGVNARATFSPHGGANAKLDAVAADIAANTTSSLLYSLAFLYQTPGRMQDAIKTVSIRKDCFVYGISDKAVGDLDKALAGDEPVGLDVQQPDGNIAPVFPAQLTANVPPPFNAEPSGGSGVRMHHKFVVIDFDKPTARVYMGSFNFSTSADLKNGENLLVFNDRRVATAYMVEALSMFDHYHFRVVSQSAKDAAKPLELRPPPKNPSDKPWFAEDYEVGHLIRDRELFA